MSAPDVDDLSRALLRAASAADLVEFESNLARAHALEPLEQSSDDTRQLFPGVMWRAKQLGATSEHLAVMKRNTKLDWAHNQVILNTATPLLDVLEQAGIQPVVLKGFAMMSSAYQNDLSARSVADLDVLIPYDAVDRAYDLLTDDGWTPRYDRSLDLLKGTAHALCFEGVRHTEVDVHWELIARGWHPVRTAALFDRTIPATLGDREVEVLDHTMQLFHCLTHVNPVGFRTLGDALTIIVDHGDQVVWDDIVHEAVERRVVGLVRESLAQIEAVHPGLVPSSPTDALGSAPLHWSDSYEKPVYTFGGAVRLYCALVSHRGRFADLRGKAKVVKQQAQFMQVTARSWQRKRADRDPEPDIA